jgi:outer membrane receptor protein involved in Fe transport
MKMSGRFLTCLFAALAVAAGTAGAQELRGRIDGAVTDNTGGVLPGVTVTVSGPALIQPQVTVTGADGSYRFPALPTGAYTLVFELSGFQTVRREEIRVSLATTVTINTQMPLAGVEETLTITGESPVVDVKNTNVGTSFTKELMQDIPNARDIWAAMAQAPGFQMNSYDVGGSHTGTQTGFSTYGFSGQNKTLLEGINVTEGQDANAGYFDFGSFEEFSIGGAGNMGEQTGPGAFLNLTIKSGGDSFSASVYYDYENDKTVGDNVPDEFRTGGGTNADGFKAPASGLSAGNPITKQYDFNVNGGGPIVKGKAWFFGSYRDNNQYKVILGLPDEAQSQLKNYTLKGTYQLDSRNQIIGFFNQRTKLQPLRELSLTTPTETAWWQSSKNRPWKVEWTSTPNNELFLDFQFAHWGNYFPLFPSSTQSTSTEGVPIGRTDLGTDQHSGAQSYYHDRTTLKPQFSGSVSYFKDDWGGSHSFKFGTEIQREQRKFLRFQPGNIWYNDRDGVPEEVWIYNTPNEGINDTSGAAFYAQDSWTVNSRLTLNLGVRFDRYHISWPDQGFTAEQSAFFDPVSTPATDVATLTSLGPRLGFAYDLTGEGKTVLKGFYGRFYFNPSTDIGSLENPVGEAEQQYRFTDLNGNLVLDPGPDGSLATSPELGPLLRTRGGAGFVRVDRDLENAYGDEVSFHVEHELRENFSLRGSYVYKNQRNGWGEVDLARYNQYSIPFAFNDVGADNVRGTADDQVINLLDRPAGIGSDRTLTNPGNVEDMPDVYGNYHTFEIGVNKRFSDRWLLLTSFEHSWLTDWRRSASSTSTLGVLRAVQPGLSGTAGWLWRPNQRYLGQAETSFWNYKLVGRYVFAYDIGVSASYKLQSGFNYPRELSVTLPNAGAEAIPAEPFDANRGPNVGIFDVRVEKAFALGKPGSVTAMLDIFNLTNSNVVTNARNRSGSRYNEVIALLDPRTVRFGIRWEF